MDPRSIQLYGEEIPRDCLGETIPAWSVPSSSARPGVEEGEWERCSVSHSRLTKLQTQGFLPHADLVPVRMGLPSFNEGTQAEDFPNPSGGERVCFIPYLLRGVGFPIHPFLRGLLEYYGLQLHNFTPASILHIAGYVALCELFLGVEAHFRIVEEAILSRPAQSRRVNI